MTAWENGVQTKCNRAIKVYDGSWSLIYLPCSVTGYAVYADPMFIDFEVVDDRKLMIYGSGQLGFGFNVSDVSVEFRDQRMARAMFNR